MDNKVKVGLTALRDGGSERANNTDLTATDIRVKLNETVTIEAEYGRTTGQGGPFLSGSGANNNAGADLTAEAYRAEVRHEGKNLYGNAFYEKRDNGFGVAGTSTFGSASERYGLETVYDFKRDKDSNAETAEKSAEFDITEGLSLFGRALRESDGLERGDLSVFEAGVRRTTDRYSVYTGLRAIEEDVNFSFAPVGQNGTQDFASNGTILQWMSGGEAELLKDRINVFGSTETPLSSDGAASLYGNRNLIGTAIRPFSEVGVTAAHQWIDLNGVDLQNSVLGLTWSPLENTALTAGADQHVTADNTFSSATLGAVQTVPLTDNTVLTFGAERKEAISGGTGTFQGLSAVPSYALPSFIREGATANPFSGSNELWENRNTFTAGIGYVEENLSVNAVGQYRNADTEDRLNLNASAVGNVNESLALGLQGGYQKSSLKGGLSIDNYLDRLQNVAQSYGGSSEYYESREARFIRDSSVATLSGGAAYRPIDEDGPLILQRVDLQMLDNESNDDIFKIVNNLAVQADLTDDLQTNAQYAVKYVEDNFNGINQSETVHAVGNELRYDVTKKIDILGQASARHSSATETTAYSLGVSVGYSPIKNVYVQSGYNFIGFRDDDFSLLSYTAQGPYLRVAAKFDQESLKESVGQVLGR